jgi:ubiquinone/menaquinone biosynthesis C-methylase UbiE
LSLRDAWEEQAPNWIRWAREPGHDSYWRFHREALLSSLPKPGRLTIDVGCGEGRITRDLRAAGHRVVGVDAAPSMIAAAREADPDGEYVEANAEKLPFEDGSADLVLAFMSLMDMDDMPGVVREIARVLQSSGRLVAAVVHPINSAGIFSSREDDDAPFVIDSYLGPRRYTDVLERDGLPMTFNSIHFTLEDYSRALEESGLMLDELRELYEDENPHWSRIPLFLRFDAVKPA